MNSVAKDHNSLALATAILARVRNPQASAVHYRISTILFHSGVKHDDLNRLGVHVSRLHYSSSKQDE